MSVSLASLQAAADSKYGSFDIDLDNGQVLKLRNPLRMSESEREEFKNFSKADEDANTDTAEQFRTMIRLAADDKELAEKFISRIGEDVALLAVIVEQYTDGVKVGEA